MTAVNSPTVSGTSRINLRLRNEAKNRLERAARFEGKSLSAFILGCAMPHAEETIQTHERMRLNAKDAQAFLAALDHPPPYNTALTTAINAHTQRIIRR